MFVKETVFKKRSDVFVDCVWEKNLKANFCE